MRTLFVCLLLIVCSCGFFVDDQNTIRAVQDQGYDSVVIVAKHAIFPQLFGASKDDAVAYHMTAINSRGMRVNLIVSSGWLFKGVTVRTR